MPETTTLGTASAGQAAAADTRLIGFYTGVGGVQVAALFKADNLVGAVNVDAAAVAADRAATEAAVAQVKQLLPAAFAGLKTVPYTNFADVWDAAVGFSMMTMAALGSTLGAGRVVSAIKLPVYAPAGAVTLRLTLRSRALADALRTNLPGFAGDTTVLTRTYNVADLGLVPGGAYADVLLTLPSLITISAAQAYLVTIELLNAGGANVNVGFGHGSGPTPATFENGWYKVGAGDWTVIDAGNAPAIIWLCASAPDFGTITGVQFDTRDRVIRAKAVVAGTTVTISGLLLREGITQGFGGAVILAAPTAGWGRVDLAYLNPETLAVGLAAGTQAQTDYNERRPAVPAGMIPLFYCTHSGTVYAGQSVHPIACFDQDGPWPRSLAGRRIADVEQGRRAIATTLARAVRGQAITLAVMGDSILAWSNNTSAAPSNSTPNGINRDVDHYLKNTGGTQQIQNDLIAALPRFDQGDGAGAIHLHASKAWKLADALGRFGSAVTVKNFALSGTNSGVGTSGIGGTSSNGRDATLLGAITASGAHLVAIGYGMNELGSAATRDNLIAIASACYGAGMDVLLFGCPRPSDFNAATDADWTYTCRAIRAAAEAVDAATGKSAALIDTLQVYSDPALGTIGLPAFLLSTANLNNHPGLREHAAEGRLAADLIGYC